MKHSGSSYGRSYPFSSSPSPAIRPGPVFAALSKANLESLERERRSPASFSSPLPSSSLASLSSMTYTGSPTSRAGSMYTASSIYYDAPDTRRGRGRSTTPRNRYTNFEKTVTRTPVSSPQPPQTLGIPSSHPASNLSSGSTTPFAAAAHAASEGTSSNMSSSSSGSAAGPRAPRVQIYRDYPISPQSGAPFPRAPTIYGSGSTFPIPPPPSFQKYPKLVGSIVPPPPFFAYQEEDIDSELDDDYSDESDCSSCGASTLSSVSDFELDSYDGDLEDDSSVYDSSIDSP